MLVYVEDQMVQTVLINLHFDDHSVERTSVTIGDNLAIRYLYKKQLIDVQGRVVEIYTNRFKQTTIKLDVSTKYHSLVLFVTTDNIRGILATEPDSFIKLVKTLNDDDPILPEDSDGYVDTLEEVIEQISWDK